MPVLPWRGRSGWLHWPRRTARIRLTAVYGGLFVVSGVALIALTYGLFRQATAYPTPRLPQVPQSPTIEAVQLPGPLRHALPLLPRALSALTQDQQQLRQVQNAVAGTTVHNQPPFEWLSLLQQDQHRLTRGQHQLTRAVSQLAAALRDVSHPRSIQAAQRASDSHHLLVDSAIALAIVVALGVVAGWLLSGRVLRPIRIITGTAQRISASNLHERLALDGPRDELKALGDTLDELLARLEGSFDAQRHFVANASHELRTPITADRNLLQVALDDPATSAEGWRATARELLASNDEQAHLIEALLALASSEIELGHRERTDLANLSRAAVSRAARDSDRYRLRVETDLQPALLDGDPKLIERLAANLVDNAVTHNFTGGHVTVRTGLTEGQPYLEVGNTGAAIPSGDLDRLFQPFQRLDPRRTNGTGHGLGLSIVRAIATSHDATVHAHPRPDGGLTVTVTFPATPPPQRVGERSTASLAAGGNA
jgi:signal transduction histidine kinase